MVANLPSMSALLTRITARPTINSTRSKQRKRSDLGNLEAHPFGHEGGDEVDEKPERLEEHEDDDEDDDEDAGLTPHGVHARGMNGKISDQEKELLAEKPWALRGEVHSHDRPQNR